MMANDVPAALAWEFLKNRTSIGIAKKPPPIPKKPVTKPIISEISTSQITGTFFSVPETGLINIDAPAINITNEKPVVMKLSESL